MEELEAVLNLGLFSLKKVPCSLKHDNQRQSHWGLWFSDVRLRGLWVRDDGVDAARASVLGVGFQGVIGIGLSLSPMVRDLAVQSLRHVVRRVGLGCRVSGAGVSHLGVAVWTMSYGRCNLINPLPCCNLACNFTAFA